ncbi:hypothetical protein [Actinacidiphila cocklensis]|nr:hypothetical protein [Actinacidiphila cocklensis]
MSSGTLDAETTWLLQVADAFARRPEISEVRRRLLAQEEHPR